MSYPEKLVEAFRAAERSVANSAPATSSIAASHSELADEIAARIEIVLRDVLAAELARAMSATPLVRECLTADEVAVFLGVDRKTVYDHANRGHIPHQKLGKRLVFSRAALNKWLEGTVSR